MSLLRPGVIKQHKTQTPAHCPKCKGIYWQQAFIKLKILSQTWNHKTIRATARCRCSLGAVVNIVVILKTCVRGKVCVHCDFVEGYIMYYGEWFKNVHSGVQGTYLVQVRLRLRLRTPSSTQLEFELMTFRSWTVHIMSCPWDAVALTTQSSGTSVKAHA